MRSETPTPGAASCCRPPKDHHATRGSLREEITGIRALSRAGRHAAAIEAAEALLRAAPDHRDLLYLVAANQRCLGRFQIALASLARLAQVHPCYGLLHQERGHCLLALRQPSPAAQAFREAVRRNPTLADSWAMLEHLCRLGGDADGAADAARQRARLARQAAETRAAEGLLADGELSAAEQAIRSFLDRVPEDVEALRLLARILGAKGALDEAEQALERAAAQRPADREVRLDHLRALVACQDFVRARTCVAELLAAHPGDHEGLWLLATVRAGLGAHEDAIELYGKLQAERSATPELCVQLGHSLKTIGRRAEAVAAYQDAASMRPGFGDAYWSLANLKTFRFSPGEVARMRQEEAAAAAAGRIVDRYHLCFALGKALEDYEDYAESWHYYATGNRLKAEESPWPAEWFDAEVRRQIAACRQSLFAGRDPGGVGAPGPIFIVGMPRSGSTLVEQILAAHPQVEATAELPDIPRAVRRLRRVDQANPGAYPEMLAELSSTALRQMAENYLVSVNAQRRGKPFFIDKMPNNFRHLGLIRLMFPGARVIDVRRTPMACCFSNFKQLYASGQEFSYSIESLARYYRAYEALMRHWDQVLPGWILRVQYEDLVADLEGQVRRLLAFCQLDFDPACLAFHRTARRVQTASSEQVRQPLNRDGLDRWRHFAPWLGPLEQALDSALVPSERS